MVFVLDSFLTRLRLTDSARLAGQWDSLSNARLMPSFLLGFWGSNSGSHACKIRALLTGHCFNLVPMLFSKKNSKDYFKKDNFNIKHCLGDALPGIS